MGIFGTRTGSPSRESGSHLGIAPDDSPEDGLSATHVLRDFVDAVSAHDEAPLLVMLGPVVNANVEFLVATVGCKLFVEEWPPPRADAPTGDREGEGAEPTLREIADASIHGVLCWDCFDYADAASREWLASELLRVLRPGGVILFRQRADGKTNPEPLRHEIVAVDRLRVRHSAGSGWHIGPPLEQRDLLQRLPGCVTVKTVLLRNRMREVLLRKAGSK